jgi:hypothetical protein
MSRNPTIRRGKGCIAKNSTASAGEFLSHFRIKTVITEPITRTGFILVQDAEDTTNKDEVLRKVLGLLLGGEEMETREKPGMRALTH